MNTEAQISYEVARDGKWRDLAGVMYQYLVDGAPDEAVKAYTEFVDDKAK